MDAANGAATATISNGGTTVTPAARTAGDTLVGRNITDYTTPDATALRECHSGEQQHPCQRCEQTADKSAGERHAAIIAARQRRRPGFLRLPAASRRSTSRSIGSPMNVIRPLLLLTRVVLLPAAQLCAALRTSLVGYQGCRDYGCYSDNQFHFQVCPRELPSAR